MTVVPVFVSSTFRDFHAERDELAGPIRDQLNERFERQGLRVEFIDLRWGVDTAALSEQERNDRVLDVCLGEIDRCRPLFLGLIGDRAGWRPPPERLRNAARTAGFTPPQLPKALTALEMAYAAARRDDHEALYVRRRILGVPPPEWVDDDRTDLESLIEALPDDQLHEYEASADGARLTGLGGFSELVVSELSARIARVADNVAAQRGDGLRAAEALRLDDLRRGFSDVTGFAQTLVGRILGGASVCVFGRSGSGKSAAWQAAVDRLRGHTRIASLTIGAVPETREHDTAVREIIAQLGGRPPVMPELARRERAMLAGLELAGVLQRRADATGELLHESLARAVSSAGTVVALDDLDRLNPSDGSRRLDLLGDLPGCALVTTADPEQMRILRARGFEVLGPPPLEGDGIAQVSRNMAALGGRALPEPVVGHLAERPRTPLWLELAIHELEALSEQEFVAAQRAGDPDPTALLLRTAAALPDDEEGMIGAGVARAVRRFGGASVASTLQLLLASPYGLRRSDLSAVSRDDELTIAAIVRELDVVLTPGVGAARVTFRTTAARAGTASRYQDLRPAHAALASWLARKPDRDTIDDLALLYHLLFTGGDVRASAEELHRGSVARGSALRLAASAIAAQRPDRTALEALIAACRQEPDDSSLAVSHRVVVMGADPTPAKRFVRDLLAVTGQLEDAERAALAHALDDPESRLEALALERVDPKAARQAVDAILAPLKREAVGTRYPAAPYEYVEALMLGSETLAAVGASTDALFLASRALEAADEFPPEADHRNTAIKLRALRTLAQHAIDVGRPADALALLDRSIDLAGAALRSWPAHRAYRQGYAVRQRSRLRWDAEDLCFGEADRLYTLRAAQADALTRKLELLLRGSPGPPARELGVQLLDLVRALVLSAAGPERDARSRARSLSRLADTAERAGDVELAAQLMVATVAQLELVGTDRSGGALAAALAQHFDLARRGGADAAAAEAWERLRRLVTHGEFRSADPTEAARVLTALGDPPSGRRPRPNPLAVAARVLAADRALDLDATLAAIEDDEARPREAARAAIALACANLVASPLPSAVDQLRETLLRCAQRTEAAAPELAMKAIDDACWTAWLAAAPTGAGGRELHQLARALSIKAELLERHDRLDEAGPVLDASLAVARRAARDLPADQQGPYLEPGIAAVRALAQRRGDTDRLAGFDAPDLPDFDAPDLPDPELPCPAAPGDRWDAETYAALAQVLAAAGNTVGADAASRAGRESGVSPRSLRSSAGSSS